MEVLGSNVCLVGDSGGPGPVPIGLVMTQSRHHRMCLPTTFAHPTGARNSINWFSPALTFEEAHDPTIGNYLPALRCLENGTDANRLLPVLLRMHRVRCSVAAKAR